MKRIGLVILLFFCCTFTAKAQRASISVDVLKLGLVVPNITAEILLSDRFTLNIETVINPFEDIYKKLYTKQITLSPELRYWFKRPMYSHCVGAGFMGSVYNIGYDGYKSKGCIAALSLTYGYSIYLNKRLSLMPTVGVGYGYGENSTLRNGVFESQGWKWSPTLTKFGIHLTYIIN